MGMRTWRLPLSWPFFRPFSWPQALCLGSLCWGVLISPPGVRAEINPDLLPSLEPLDLSIFQQPRPTQCLENTPPGTVKTALTICSSRLTDPSLWWAKQLYGDALIDNWITYFGDYSDPGRVDVVVNSQVWNTWNYVDRYSFIDRFGAAAQRQGYNVRVFDWQSRFLAAYTCDFGEPTMVSMLPANLAQGEPINDWPRMDQLDRPPLACQVLLNPSGRSALRGRSTVIPNGNGL